eukprot:CAMPEP_0203770646 /NCGR_PEP_ID=MMETSP0099_2-20121227/2947_1 /ASSEMBLY_ACC=CAM_ASM_000209 /TAXON_ID=96639 /ORGANISM=" , Strain NY0313808BC1" /LENGTH=132 /DNA_ID=CAMNT_0050667847 /DNA_START=374 /DNA_END=769 /DNA_ORIENTATION=+
MISAEEKDAEALPLLDCGTTPKFARIFSDDFSVVPNESKMLPLLEAGSGSSMPNDNKSFTGDETPVCSFGADTAGGSAETFILIFANILSELAMALPFSPPSPSKSTLLSGKGISAFFFPSFEVVVEMVVYA